MTDTGTITTRLLAHYDAHRRDLPWRGVDDPYAVWVSEIMLQQTGVDAVVPYYERWLERFPTLEDLADAGLDDVLRHWEGLGYYRRARSLHAAARMVRERHGGALPSDPDTLRELPGVGPYTAGAIASIAFGVPAPAVDGNVRRVLSRVYDLPAPTDAELHELATSLVPEDRPGDFNQALMELGATVCTPRSPACEACPIAGRCQARALGVQEQRPAPKPRAAIPERLIATAVGRRPDGRVLLVRRPEDGLLGGLWEFPGTEVEDGAVPAAAARQRLLELGVAPSDDAARPLETVDHTFSHFRARYRPWLFQVPPTGPATETPDRLWRRPHDLDGLAMPVAQRKIAALVVEGDPT